MRMRVSGERSSCEALASSDLCERTRVSTRAAACVEAAAPGRPPRPARPRHARRQVALAPALHAALQVFQPLGQPAHDRVDAERHRHAHDAHDPAQPGRGRAPPGRRRALAAGAGVSRGGHLQRSACGRRSASRRIRCRWPGTRIGVPLPITLVLRVEHDHVARHDGDALALVLAAIQRTASSPGSGEHDHARRPRPARCGRRGGASRG